MAHHVAKVDREALDVPRFLARCPGPLRAAILALEWLHLPVLSLVIQARAITRSLWDPERRDERRHAAAVLAVRALLFAGFGALSLRGLLGYFQGYLTAILVLRFGDAFQHTYDAVPVGADVPARDGGYEQANTFTPLLSRRRPRLNLILLNFGYHNAHHARMSCPWHSLHELDRALFGAPHDHQIDLGTQLRNFHRFRMERILHGNRAATAERGRPVDELRGTLTIPLFVKL
jgi:fatty acid desaturase